MSAYAEKLTIILGCPASGKTTLARRLGAELRLPLLCKDDIKEALFDTLGAGGRAWSRQLSVASFTALSRLAAAQLGLGLSCIVEGNWRPGHESLFQGLAGQGALQICCIADPAEVYRRFCSRCRHPGHLDEDMEAADIDAAARRPPEFLDLPGRRLVYRSDAPDAYPVLWRNLEVPRL